MELKDYISISGKPGLYKIVNQTKSGFIVESLVDQKRFPTYHNNQVMSMEDVSIYGEEEDVHLSIIFQNIAKKENLGKSIDSKSDKETLKSYFEEIFPEYDKDRVYPSDIKKVISWYNILQEAGCISLDEEKSEEKKEASEEVKEEK